MMHKGFLMLLGVLLSLSACQQQDELSLIYEDLLGRWNFVEVSKEPLGAPIAERESILTEYEDDELELLDDGRLRYTESTDTSVVLEGIWSLTYGESDFILSMTMNGLNNELILYTWTIITFRNDNLFVIETTKDEHYRYDLERVE